MAMTYGGVMYFPLKVNLFDEVPMELIEAKFGLKGTAAIMKLLCKIYKDNGYYLTWNKEQCTLFTNKVGRDISEEEMQGIVDILVEKGFFDLKLFKEQQVLTSIDIQKVWLEATKRRKKEAGPLPYLLVKMDKGESNCTQKQGNCTQDADIPPENADNCQQSIVEQSKANENKVLPPLIPQGERGNMDAKSSALDIPGYAYNKKTHNLECLFLSLQNLHITDSQEIQKILKLSDYGRLGGCIWKIIHNTNWSKVNSRGGYLISILAKERRTIIND